MKTVFIILLAISVVYAIKRCLCHRVNEKREGAEFEAQRKAEAPKRVQNAELFEKRLSVFDSLSNEEQKWMVEIINDISSEPKHYAKCNDIISEWIVSLSLTKNKIKLVNEYYAQCCKWQYTQDEMAEAFDIAIRKLIHKNTKLTEEKYRALDLLLSSSWISQPSLIALSDMASNYIKANGIAAIKDKDMIINRPCYLKGLGEQITLRQKDGELFYDFKNSRLVKIYLFEDAIEFLSNGHQVLRFADILDIGLDRELNPEELPEEGQVVLMLTPRKAGCLYLLCDKATAAHILAILPVLQKGEMPRVISKEIEVETKIQNMKKPTSTKSSGKREVAAPKATKERNSSVFLLPWIGKNYKKGISGKKVLVLGESHYAKPEEWSSDFTNHIIRDCYLNPENPHEGWKNTYVKFERALAGHELSQEEKESLWNKIMFWNFVQEPIAGPRIAPLGAAARSADGLIHPLPGYLYSGTRQIEVVADDSLKVEMSVSRRVRDLLLELTVAEGNPERIASVKGTISGIAGAFDLAAQKTTGEAVSTAVEFTLAGDKLTADARLLGVTGDRQTLVIDIVFTDGRTQTTESDLTEYLKDFNAAMTEAFRLAGDLNTPVEAGMNATITGWQPGNGGGEDVDIH